MAQGHGLRRGGQTYDTQLEIMDAEAFTTTNSDGTETAYIDLGGGDQANTPMVYGDLVIDIDAADATTGDELYEIILEGSTAGSAVAAGAAVAGDATTFEGGTVEELARLHIGAFEVLSEDSTIDGGTGRYVVPFSNERNGNTYRYARVMVETSGTTPILTISCHMAMRV